MNNTNTLQLGMALIIAFATYSCKKDTIAPDTHDTSTTIQENEIMQKSQIIERNLLNFKKRLENYTSQKNGLPIITYEIDSAIWYLESSLNYTYSNPTEITKAHTVDSFEVVLNKTIDGKIDLAEMQRGYNETVTSLSAIYNAVNYSDKVFKLSDLEVLSEDAQKVTIQVKGDIGEKTDNNKNTTTSGWSWGQKQGYYHPNGQIYYAGDLDATDIIENRANSIFNPQPTHDAYGNPITPQQGIRMVVLNPIDNHVNLTPYSNGIAGLLWQESVFQNSPSTFLLSANDIITFASNAVTIANMPQFQGTNPPPALIDVADDLIPSGMYPYPIFHRINTITYGNVIWVSTPMLTL